MHGVKGRSTVAMYSTPGLMPSELEALRRADGDVPSIAASISSTVRNAGMPSVGSRILALARVRLRRAVLAS